MFSHASSSSFELAVEAAKKAVKAKKKGENFIKGQVSTEVTNIMAKQNASAEYIVALDEFSRRLSKDQARAAGDEKTVVAFIETGRKFDKILISVHKKGAKSTAARVHYFVDKRDGAIYGAKSPLAPNLKRFFGTVYSAEKWDWSGEFGQPFNEAEAGVIMVGRYGDTPHYMPLPKNTTAKSA